MGPLPLAGEFCLSCLAALEMSHDDIRALRLMYDLEDWDPLVLAVRASVDPFSSCPNGASRLTAMIGTFALKMAGSRILAGPSKNGSATAPTLPILPSYSNDLMSPVVTGLPNRVTPAARSRR